MSQESENNPPAEDQGTPPETGDETGDEGPRLKFKSDESWKEQARQEKEKLDSESRESGERRLPPASFSGLINDLGLQTMLGLGLIAPPGAEGAPPIDLQAARYTIDILAVLEEKTRNNLSEAESGMLAELLNTLRMRFVEASRRKQKEESKIVTDETLIKDPSELRKERGK